MTLEITRITEQKLKICVPEINEKNNTEPKKLKLNILISLH